MTPALPTSLGCTEEGVGTGRSQTRGQPRVILHWEPQWQAPYTHTYATPPLPRSLEEPTLPQTLTNHQGCGLEIGIKGTTALPIFQEDAPHPVLCQREVLHILQGSRRVGSGAHQGMSGLGGKGGGCWRRQLYEVREDTPQPVLPTQDPGHSADIVWQRPLQRALVAPAGRGETRLRKMGTRKGWQHDSNPVCLAPGQCSEPTA